MTRAIVLAAGKGTRMRPLTNTMPKPMINVHGKPLIDWCLAWLRSGGVAHVVVNTSYLAEPLEAHLQRHHAEVTLSREEPEPLETGGGILHALPHLGDAPFIAMNSDAIFAHKPMSLHPIRQMLSAWDEAQSDFLMLLVPLKNAHGWEGKGDFIRLPNGQVRRARNNETADYIFSGVELIHPRVFTDCPEGAFSLSALWKRSLNAEGVYTRVHSVVYDGDWLNVGDLDALAATEAYFSAQA